MRKVFLCKPRNNPKNLCPRLQNCLHISKKFEFFTAIIQLFIICFLMKEILIICTIIA